MDSEYRFHEIEAKWQKKWEKEQTFVANAKSGKERIYTLEMFPYPSGKIHMGHVSNYTIVDSIARYYALAGYEVLHPIGWDAFGLPAENAAITNKIPPAKWTYENIATMKGQLQQLGFSYDWTREVATCDPEYYKWGQWFLLKMYEKGLLYRKAAEVNWCDECATVLANEQVHEGKCWRCDSDVIQKPLEQWYIKITDYVEDLLEGHDELAKGWPERVLTMQKNWIGKSVGANITFTLDDGTPFPIFTTRPDTIFGVSFMAIAWNHATLMDIVTDDHKDEVAAFIEKSKKIDQREDFEKEGVFTGRYVINPFNDTKVPLYAANFVLAEYGSGRIMAVPAHDERDFQFAKKYNLPLHIVIQNENASLVTEEMENAYVDDGTLVNSGQFTGQKNRDAIDAIIAYAEEKGFGKREVQYKLRDWLISRQRYWGNPIPFVYCDVCGIVPVPESDLPVLLPTDVELAVGGNPLAKIDEFVNTTCPKCGAPAKRETDTMDTFICSSWYYARYVDARNESAPFSREDADAWLPVGQYVGGIEHACMHLLYARFWHKFMRDLGLVTGNEPFTRLLTQGMVLAESYFAPASKTYYTKEEVDEGRPEKENAGEIVRKIDKMSKSKRNGVDPDDLITHFGADTVRVFIMFASPPEMDLEWSDEGVKGASRYLNRVWRLYHEYVEKIANVPADGSGVTSKEAKTLRGMYHKTIKKVTEDVKERYHFNTAIAALMELLNALNAFTPKDDADLSLLKEILTGYAVLLNPIAPHITEELFALLGNEKTIIEHGWIAHDEALAKDDTFELVMQVNGKIRAREEVPVAITKDEALAKAKAVEKIAEEIAGKTVVKEIFVPKKLVNIVVKAASKN